MLATNKQYGSESESESELSHASANESKNEEQLTPVQSSALRKNDIVLLKNKPCKIVEMSTSKPGKHGHSKIHFVGLDIFTGKKYEDIAPTSKNMMVPEVEKVEYQLQEIVDDEFVILKDMKVADKTEKLKLPEGRLGEEIRNKYKSGKPQKITVIQAMNCKGVSACRPDK